MHHKRLDLGWVNVTLDKRSRTVPLTKTPIFFLFYVIEKFHTLPLGTNTILWNTYIVPHGSVGDNCDAW
jgi:hypothetical protein